MLVRILNTLPSRIWDGLFFLFSGYSKSTVGEKEVLQKVMDSWKISLSLLLCSLCVYDAHPHLKYAPKPHLGWIIFFFFLAILNLQFGEKGGFRRLGILGKLVYPFFSVVSVFMMLVRIKSLLQGAFLYITDFDDSVYSKLQI